ncbi:MAG: hypothetical protein LBR15_11020 [Methanobrevibacter sp.]|jgi:hypothetical protein|nr:hypothetical protein [Candidatus Methanovirga australis]
MFVNQFLVLNKEEEVDDFMSANKIFGVLVFIMCLSLVTASNLTNESNNLANFNESNVLNVSFNGSSNQIFNLLSTQYMGIHVTGSIQDAVNQASPGDTLILENKTYIESNININKNLTIRSDNGAKPIVNGNGEGSVFNIRNGSSVTIDGLSIIGGINSGINVEHYSNSTIINCNIYNNSADYGGGANFDGTNNSVVNCNIYNNSANCGGGADFYGSNNIVVGCSFFNNSADYVGGGAYFVGSGHSVVGCGFFNNSANNNGGGAFFAGSNNSVANSSFFNNSAINGGGVFFNADNNGDNNIVGCSFFNNRGGGAYFVGSGYNIVDCSFYNNSATGNGGGAYINGGTTVSNCNFYNNSATGNGGGAFDDYYDSYYNDVTNCSFFNNSAGGSGAGAYISDGDAFWGYGNSVISCNFFDNSAIGGSGGVYAGAANIINYCRIFNNSVNNTSSNLYSPAGNNIDCNWWGVNNISDAGISGEVMPNSFYQVQLKAGNNSYYSNSSVMGSAELFPLNISYSLVLNGTNNSSGVDNLPDFTGTIKYYPISNNGFNTLNKFFKNNQFEVVDDENSWLGVGNSDDNTFSVDAKSSWSTVLNDSDVYGFNAIVDNENLLLKIGANENDTVINITCPDLFNVSDNLTGTAKLRTSSGVLLGDKDLNVIVTDSDGSNFNKTLKTDSSGEVDLSNLGYVFNSAGDYVLNFSFAGDGEYNPCSVNRILKVNKSDTVIGLSCPDLFNVSSVLTGLVKLRTYSGVSVGNADLNVSVTGPDGSSFNKTLKTGSDGVVDLSALVYNFTVAGKYNLSVTYSGDNYYGSCSFTKEGLVVYPFPVPFNGTFNFKGYSKILLDNSHGSVFNDSVVLYNMSDALNGYVLDGDVLNYNAKARIVDSILTINWNVPVGEFGYVIVFVKKI